MGLRYSPDVAWQVVGGQAVIIDLAGGTALGLNGTGSAIWRLLESRSVDEIVVELCQRFEVDAGIARADVQEVIGDLLSRGLLVEAP